MAGKLRLELKPMPDGFGYLYGQVFTPDGNAIRVDILPPVAEWRGDIKPGPDTPHPTDWIVYANGDEIARVTRREDLQSALADLCLERKR